MKVHFVIHENFEAPGAYETWAISKGCEVAYTRLYAGDVLPSSAEDIDLLVVMGGPQCPATTQEECAHFSAKKEKSLILKCVEEDKAVVGICLGSQLIGEALGAKFDHSPEREIGNFPIFLTEFGKSNSKFTHFGDTLSVGHWHQDMPGLTPNSKIVAYSEGCPRQIVEYTSLVYGFQCHMELTRDVVELLINNWDDKDTHSKYKFVDSPEKLRSHDYEDMNRKLHEFLDKLLDDYKMSKK